MTDITSNTEPQVDAAPAKSIEESVAAPAETVAEAEQTFSTAVEPSDAPVLNADGTILETAVEESTDEHVAAAEVTEGEVAENSPPVSTGSDKKSKSWISKLTQNIKKLADKKPKVEKSVPATTEADVPAATEEAAAANTEGETEAEIVTETVTETVVEEVAVVTETEVAATTTTDETEAAEEKPAATEPAATEPAATEETAPAHQKIGKRLSFNFFKKSNKSDKEKEKEKEKAAPAVPATVAETTENAETTDLTVETTNESEEVAPSTPAKDVPVTEPAHVASEVAVEETAVAAAH